MLYFCAMVYVQMLDLKLILLSLTCFSVMYEIVSVSSFVPYDLRSFVNQVRHKSQACKFGRTDLQRGQHFRGLSVSKK